MRIDDGNCYVLAYVARKIRRGLRQEAGRAMASTYVRVLKACGDKWDVEVHRSGSWRQTEINLDVLRDAEDVAAVRKWFENKMCGE